MGVLPPFFGSKSDNYFPHSKILGVPHQAFRLAQLVERKTLNLVSVVLRLHFKMMFDISRIFLERTFLEQVNKDREEPSRGEDIRVEGVYHEFAGLFRIASMN